MQRITGGLRTMLWAGLLACSMHTSAAASVDVDASSASRAGQNGDADGDGIDDSIDIDDDNDTLTDDQEGDDDTDNDGIADCLDLDSDNDGIVDLIEAVTDRGLLDRLDADGDGQLDQAVALGRNGLADPVETQPDSGQSTVGRGDQDSDGRFDQIDLDADNDGLPDIIESGGTDNDFDGRLDRFRDIDGNGLSDQLTLFPITVRDTDKDGIFDFRDLDSDQDGRTDLLESSGDDVDGDGRLDRFEDSDGDGLDDAYSATTAGTLDIDGNGVPDQLESGPDESTASEPGDSTADPGSDSGPDAAGSAGGDEPVAIGQEGGAVGGCSVTAEPADPVLPLLAIAALLLLYRSRSRDRDRCRPRSVPCLMLATVLATPACSSLRGGSSPVDGDAAVPSGDAARAAQSTDASPSSSWSPGVHVGLGVGVSQLDVGTDGTALEVDDDSGTTLQLTLGRTRGRYALEGRVASLGEATFESTSDTLGYRAADLSALVHLSSRPVDPYLRLGIGTLFTSGDVDTDVQNRFHLLLGAGIDWQLANRWGLRAELSAHDVDATSATISVVYRAGGTAGSTAPPVVDVAGDQSLDAADEPARRDEPADDDRAAGAAGATEAQAESEPETRRSDDGDSDPATPDEAPSTASNDADEDGVLDARDQCPTTIMAPEVRVDSEGCVLFGGAVAGIEFAADSDRLLPGADAVLLQVLEVLEADDTLRLTVASHVHDLDDADANLLLSRRRTLSVLRHLTDRGIAVARVRPQAFGDTVPLDEQALSGEAVSSDSRLELFLR